MQLRVFTFRKIEIWVRGPELSMFMTVALEQVVEVTSTVGKLAVPA